MADMLHQTFNDFILSAMLLTYGIIDLLPQQLRNNQTFYKAPGRMWFRGDVTLTVWRHSCYDNIIYDVICIGAWQTVYAMVHQFFNDIRNCFYTPWTQSGGGGGH